MKVPWVSYIMRHCIPACRIFYVLFLLDAVVLGRSNVQPKSDSDVCVLQARRGIEIRASLKPSLSAQNNLRQTLDLSKARCCLEPDQRCLLRVPLNVTLDNVASFVKYPIRPLSMMVNKQRIPRMAIWDDTWYSLYEFEKPSLTQSVDVKITRKNSANVDEETSFLHLSSDDSVSTSSPFSEASARLVTSPHRFLLREEDRIMTEDVLLLIPELTANIQEDDTIRRGSRDVLVAKKTLFDLSKIDCLDQTTCSPSPTFSVKLANQHNGVFIGTKVRKTDSEPRKTLLSSLGTLHDPATISRDRSSVVFISQQPLNLRISIPTKETSLMSAVIGFLDTAFTSFSLYSRHLESFLDNQYTLATNIICDGYDVITQHVQLFATFLKSQWSSAVDVLYSTAEQLYDLVGSFDNFDHISFEKSIDYQWNLIWLFVDQACQEIGLMVVHEHLKMAAGLIAVIAFIVAIISSCVTSRTDHAECSSNPCAADSSIYEKEDDNLPDDDAENSATCKTPRSNRADNSINCDNIINVGQTDGNNKPVNKDAVVFRNFGRYDVMADFIEEACKQFCPPSFDYRDKAADDYTRVMNSFESPSYKDWTPAEVCMGMDIDNMKGYCKLLQRTVSDPLINHKRETIQLNSHLAIADTIQRCSCDFEIRYSYKSHPKLKKAVIEPPKQRILKLVLKEPKKLPPPVDEGTDIDEEYYCYHKYYKEIIPLRDYYTYRPTRPAVKSPAQQTTNDGPSTSKTGSHGPQPLASLSARPTDISLLDQVIEQSKTDEGTDIDKAYYLYHQSYMGTVAVSYPYTYRPLSHEGNSPTQAMNATRQTGFHYIRRIQQALMPSSFGWTGVITNHYRPFPQFVHTQTHLFHLSK